MCGVASNCLQAGAPSYPRAPSCPRLPYELLCRTYDIVSRTYELLCRTHDLAMPYVRLTRSYVRLVMLYVRLTRWYIRLSYVVHVSGLLCRTYDLLCRTYDLLCRTHDLLCRTSMSYVRHSKSYVVFTMSYVRHSFLTFYFCRGPNTVSYASGMFALHNVMSCPSIGFIHSCHFRHVYLVFTRVKSSQNCIVQVLRGSDIWWKFSITANWNPQRWPGCRLSRTSCHL